MNVRRLGVVVPLGAADIIMDIDVEHYDEGAFTVENLGPNAFDAFEVRVLMHASGDPVTLASAAGDYSTPLWPLRRVVGAPVTLAAGAVTAIFMNLQGIKRLRFYASAATGAGTADVHGQIK